MTDIKEIKALQARIAEAVQIAAKKMVEDKRSRNETMVIYSNGEIKYLKL